MKYFLVFACLLAVAYAGDKDAHVIRSEAEVNVDNYKYALELDNSVKQEQQGHLEGESLKVKGKHSWTSPEGEPISIVYTADENGYHVESANPPLPVAPPVPAAILRSLEFIRTHPAPETRRN